MRIFQACKEETVMTYLERARAFFEKDIFATQMMGIVIAEVGDGYARCEMPINEKVLNAEGTVMGGALFTLADFAFAVAANLNQPQTVSLSCQVTFLSPPRGTRLLAEARQVKSGRRTCYFSVEVRDDTDAIVAVVGVSGFIKRPPEQGQNQSAD